MSATYRQAVDDMLATFKDAWDGTGLLALYPNRPGEPPDDSSSKPQSWARVHVQHGPAFQATLPNQTGQSLYERQGLFTVQIFVPSGNGVGPAYDLAKIVTDAFQGTSTPRAVWFRRARIREIGQSGTWFQLNVLVEFTYDERS